MVEARYAPLLEDEEHFVDLGTRALKIAFEGSSPRQRQVTYNVAMDRFTP